MEQKPGLTNPPPPSNIESAVAQSPELRRKNRIKLVMLYIVLFIVFQTLVITAFDLTVMRIRRPKYRIHSINIQNLSINNSTNSPSFSMKFNAEIIVKNRNFGPYKFENSFLTFSYNGISVGEAVISRSTAKVFSTKKMKISLTVDSESVSRNSNLGREISSGRLEFNGASNLRGQVELMKVIKKNKAAKMNCSMIIDLAKKVVQETRCD
ncbi:Late embryogenesis abundant (LEA) hydroxyproline-rich glycoprotein family [Forsythia ovata]|uniref:Late embryogenesis abundant (LEA) hydroxyproline-rich glycoprotein family n=1 Tax=Forsythia ovata TaxID=205694 RepID=A0ABD1X5E0_9LAMI